ncbi:hypothetical protein MBLNU230_g4071t1 [Neophaeotheca triangularis]
MSEATSPLSALPAELVLRIIDFADVPSVAALTQTSREWHKFIDDTHQQAIYSSPTKTSQPPNNRDLAFLDDYKSFAKYYDGATTWKEACKRQTMLQRNWNSEQPVTRESVLKHINTSRVWRFRPDFKRRLFIATAEHGGLLVSCMDTGERLWSLSPREVRPCAHLEYQESSGTAVFDRHGNAVEVWKTDWTMSRGEFRRVAILPHNCLTRGFQLSYDTLCVVSSEGFGFVYDMEPEPSKRTTIKIAQGAIGHLDQDEEVVMYSLGEKGYHVHDKTSGQRLGVINPSSCPNICHIRDPDEDDVISGSGNQSTPFPPTRPSRQRTQPLKVQTGPFPFKGSSATRNPPWLREFPEEAPEDDDYTPLDEDEWGAGMLDGHTMVGISAGGRAVICPNWRDSLVECPNHDKESAAGDNFLEELYGQEQEEGHNHMTVIECEQDDNPENFHLGGWLSIHKNRVLWTCGPRIYILALEDDGTVIITPATGDGEDDSIPSNKASYCVSTSAISAYAPPVSFMAVYDDCIMSTYATAIRVSGRPGSTREHLLKAKAIRVLSFAPDPETGDKEIKDEIHAEGDSDEEALADGEGMGVTNGQAVVMSLLELLQQYR